MAFFSLTRRSLGLSQPGLSRLARSFSTPFSAVEVIAKKRAGSELSTTEVESFVDGFHRGEVEDYQASAWMMAICLQGMSERETADLTRAMTHSGLVADLRDVPGVKVDKHSTGGVGDKISLVLAPLVASAGLIVPMMSGRGLGHTGGTLDKLEAIPGFRVDLSMDEFKNTLRAVGVAMVSPAGAMAPVDRRLYALRDVTATVRSIPLQTASIMCKKLAENPDSLVLDVKHGRGAFNPTTEEAVTLARSLIAAGVADGKPTSAFITSMEQPVGRAVGNWFEVVEAIDALRGEGPEDLAQLSLLQAAQLFVQGGLCATLQEGVDLAQERIASGAALEKFYEMVEAQGGDLALVKEPERYPRAAHEHQVLAPAAGYVRGIDALEIGQSICLTAVGLGAGRRRVEDGVDFTAGVWLKRKVGEAVLAGEPLCVLHTNRSDDELAAASQRALAAFDIQPASDDDAPPVPEPLVSFFVDKDGAATAFSGVRF